MDTEAAELLDHVGALRRNTRRDRSGYWLPLLLFGVLVLAAPLAYHGSLPPTLDNVPHLIGPTVQIGGFFYPPLLLFTGLVSPPANPLAVGIYWLAATVVGAVATLLWYRWRAARVGVQQNIAIYLWCAFGALAMTLVGIPVVLRWTLFGLLGGSTAATVWISVAAFVVGVGVAVLAAGLGVARTAGRSVPRVIGLVIGVAVALVGAGNIADIASTHGFAALFVIAAGLVALAWMERSPLCGTVAVLFTGAALLANLYDMENVFFRWFGYTDNQVTTVLDNLLLPGAVLVIGGAVALVTSWRRGRE